MYQITDWSIDQYLEFQYERNMKIHFYVECTDNRNEKTMKQNETIVEIKLIVKIL